MNDIITNNDNVLCTPCVKTQGLSNAQFICNDNFSIVHSIAIHFFNMGSVFVLIGTFQIYHSQAAYPGMFFLVDLFELQTPANDGNFPGDFGSRAEMSLRVQKGGLWSTQVDIRTLVPMFYLKFCDHIHIYIYIHIFLIIAKKLATFLRNYDFPKEK